MVLVDCRINRGAQNVVCVVGCVVVPGGVLGVWGHVSCSHCTYDGLLVFLFIFFLQQNRAIKLLCNDVVLV